MDDGDEALLRLLHPSLAEEAREEVVALHAIFAPDFKRVPDAHRLADEAAYEIVIPVAELPEALRPTIVLWFPAAYPHHAPPQLIFDRTPVWWTNDMAASSEERLRKQWQSSDANCRVLAPETWKAGLHASCRHDVVCFDWLEWLRAFIGSAVSAMAQSHASSVAIKNSSQEPNVKEKGPSGTANGAIFPDLPLLTVAPTPTIRVLYSHAEPITDRKSAFLAHGAFINAPTDPKQLISYMMQHRRIARATHNITAYRLVMNQNDREVVIQDCDDDGEDAAGKRLLHLLQLAGTANVWVCVSRWYGGIQLGSDRFAHINNAARQVLEGMGVVGSHESTRGKSDKSKKSRK